MSYEESFLDTADAEGNNVPGWAMRFIFKEHGSDVDEFTDATPEPQWFNGEAILEWLGY